MPANSVAPATRRLYLLTGLLLLWLLAIGLRLEEASLRDPERIDALAQQMGLVAPQAGQIIRMDSGDERDAGGPVMARVSVVVPTIQY